MEAFYGILIPFLGTSLGAACVFFMKKSLSDAVQRSLTGFAAGVMVAASVWSLLIPAMEQCEAMGRWAFAPAAGGFLLGIAFLLMAAEGLLSGHVPFSGLLAVMSMAATLRRCGGEEAADALSAQYGQVWLAAEALLFVLVGAAVDVRYTLLAGAGAVLLIVLALAVRSVGVWLSTAGAGLGKRERVFCVLAYLPKATVQAAVGGVPLAMGLPCGELVLSTAVLSILLTAPLGALAIDTTAERLLQQEE